MKLSCDELDDHFDETIKGVWQEYQRRMRLTLCEAEI
jgi:hypothetical protein